MGTFTSSPKKGLMFFVMLLTAGISFGQVDVTATGGTLSQSYTTLGDAFNAVNAGTHTGIITIGISASTSESGPCVLNSSGAGSASYTSLTIKPTTDGVSISGATATGRGLIELSGADNVTIDGDNAATTGINRNLTITNTAANTVTFTMAIRVALSTLITTADNISIKNCNINGSATGRNISTANANGGTENNTYGVYVSGGASTATVTTVPNAISSLTTSLASGQTANNFTVDNCQITACAKGIAFHGAVVGNCNNLTLTNNVIGDATPNNATTVYSEGISAQGFTAAVIRGNTIRNIDGWVGSSTGSNCIGGILLGNITNNGTGAVVEKNIIQHVYARNAGTWPSVGIYLALSATSNTTIKNNFISDINRDMSGGTGFGTALNCSGIKILAGSNYNIYNNSVQMFGSYLGTSNNSLLSSCLSVLATSQTNVDVRNNVFSNIMTGGGTSIAHVCVHLPSGGTSAMNFTENNNAYFCGSASSQGLGFSGTTYSAAGLYSAANFNPAATTPTTNWRAYTSTLNAAGTNDNASLASTTAAPFTSTTNLHINAGAANAGTLNSAGAIIASVTDDIDGDARTGPDMGADEFVYAVYPIDMMAIALAAPVGNQCLGNATVTITIKNNGGLPIDFSINPVTVSATATGGYSSSAVVNSGVLAVGATQNVNMAATANLSVPGSYTFNASVSVTGDGNNANDAMTPAPITSFGNVVVTSGSPYSQDFEAGQAGWSSGGTSSSWAFGTANKTVIKNSALPATVGTNVWTTGGLGTGTYNSNEQSFVLSPCFDLSGLNPAGSEILMTVWWNSERNFDGVQLQYSTNGGSTWTNIGLNGDPNNWYNSNTMSATAVSTFFGGNTNWWSGRTSSSNGSNGWVAVKHDLPAAAVVSGVRFRVAFATDGSGTDDGFAFDNVIIREKVANNVGVSTIVDPAPGSASCGSASQPVTVTIANYGGAAQSNIPVTVNVTGTITQTLTGTFAGPLAAGTSANYTIGSINMLTAGSYTFNAFTSLSGDAISADNAMPAATASSVGYNVVTPATPYTQDFESGQGGWTSGGTANSWAFGTANKTVIKNSALPAAVGTNVWTTGGLSTGTYNSSEQSFVISPCFDLSSLNPTASEILLTVWWNSERNFDGAQLQYSTNGGSTWTNIGLNGDPNNWYNSGTMSNTAVSTFFGGNTNWWSGRNSTGNGSSGWVLAKHDLPAAAVAGNVRFRIVFASDGSGVDDGFAFDNVIIREKVANDVGVLTLTSPVPGSAICGTNAQPVTVVIANFGSATQTNIPVTVNVTGAVTQTLTGTFAGPIAGNTTASYTIGNLNMTTPGTYTFNAFTSLGIDAVNGNNAMTAASVSTTNPVVALNANPSPACAGQAVSLTATVSGTPAGSASFTYPTAQPIPDGVANLAGSTSSTISISSPNTLTTAADLKVTLNFGTTASATGTNREHTWLGDLIVTLTTPGGSTVVFDRMGVPVSSIGDGDDMNGSYTFATTGATTLPTTTGSSATGGNVNNGTYKPSNQADAAHNWTGLTFPFSAVGNWTLTVRDTGVGDVGDLNSWSLTMPGLYTDVFSGPGTIGSVTYSGSFNSVATTSVTGAPVGNQVYSVVTTDPSGCSSTKTTNLTVNACVNTWEGDVSTDWFTAGNWSLNFVPNICGATAVIPTSPIGGLFPVISGASASVGDITVQDNATVTIDPSRTLSVCGTWLGGSSAASQILGDGIVVLNGSSVQQLQGKTEFRTLLLNNPSGAVMQSGSFFDIFTELDLQSGDLNTVNGTLRFRSTADNQIAIIDNFSAGYSGGISGPITAERYYNSSSTYDAHYMGSPVNNAPLSQFGAGGVGGYAVPTATCDETQLIYGSPYGTVARLDETNGASCALGGWFFETGGNADNARGYSVRKSGAGVLTVIGAPNLGSSYSLGGLGNSSWSNVSLQGRPMTSGWQLVANPYLAYLDATDIPAGFDPIILVWHTSGAFAGSYQQASQVAPFQAFMVHVSVPGSPQTYTINGASRIKPGSPAAFQKTNDQELTITAANTATQLLDVTTVAFNTDATVNMDAQYDGMKVAGALNRHTLYTHNANPMQWLAVNTLKSIEETSTVPVGFEAGISGNYSFSFGGVNSFDPTSYITLEDKKLNIFHDVRSGDYSFTADATDNFDRFVLHFTPAAKINTTNASCSASGQINIEQPGAASWNYSVTNSNGVVVSSGTLNQANPVTVSAATGVYTVSLTDANNYTVVKNIQVSGAQQMTAGITTSATVAETGEDIVFNSLSSASSYTWNFGDGTTANTSSASHSYTAEGVYTVALEVTNADGCNATASQQVTVNSKATGINNLTDSKLTIWSNEDRVYVDFSKQKHVEATIDIYNVLGQVVSSEKFGKTTIYSRQLNNLEAGYVVVSVKTDTGITTKKVFITNSK
ncbi:MAG: PKD domain-containing protein [Chitinophagales bacterium]